MKYWRSSLLVVVVAGAGCAHRTVAADASKQVVREGVASVWVAFLQS